MIVISDLIELLIFYSWDDWQVICQEVCWVIVVICNDNVFDVIIVVFDKSGLLIKLFQWVGLLELVCLLIVSIVGCIIMQCYQVCNVLICSLINNFLGIQIDNWIYFFIIIFFDICVDFVDVVGCLGFVVVGVIGVVSQVIQGLFSGVGVIGVNLIDLLFIVFGDQFKLFNKDLVIVIKYSNLFGDLGVYLSQFLL